MVFIKPIPKGKDLNGHLKNLVKYIIKFSHCERSVAVTELHLISSSLLLRLLRSFYSLVMTAMTFFKFEDTLQLAAGSFIKLFYINL